MTDLALLRHFIEKYGPTPSPADIEAAVNAYLEAHPEAVAPIDDTAGEGDTNKLWSADKTATETESLKEAIEKLDPSATSGDVGKFLKAKTVSGGKVTEWELGIAGGGGSVDLFYVTPEDYGAVGDGETDDSEAVQDAIDAGYGVRFGDNKTYYLASPVEINHDCHLIGGENTVIKTKTPSGGTVNNAIMVSGTLKKTTTLTTDYSSVGTTNNSGNQFTLSDMDGISVGDIMVITAEDQYYSYARPTYYLGATLLISDIYDGHIYTSNSMPWDIENTADVSVTIYSAPSVIIENLHLESDMDSLGSYKMLIGLKWCKNSVIRNCNLSKMAIGLRVDFCVNTLIDCVTVSKSKYNNSLTGDGYGIYITSSTETIIQRVLAICAQGCVDLGGTIPNINTYIRNCNLTSECRAVGIDMHENSYNIVVEDCTMGGLSLYGTATVNRCRFIRNNRSDASGNAIVFRGTHNPDWATLKVSNCVFDGSLIIDINRPIPQNAVQAFDNIIGSVVFEDCVGGYLSYAPDTSADVTSNTIKNLVLRNWKNCDRFKHNSGSIVENMTVVDCTFTISNGLWATDNVTAHGVYLDYIKHLDFYASNPLTSKTHVESAVCGCKLTLPSGVSVVLTSGNSETAKYIICGNNLTSDNIADYLVENVSGNVGATLTRTIATGTGKPTISMNDNGGIVYSQGGGTGNYGFAPVGMVYAKEASVYSISATLKNTGDTTGQTFYPYIAIVNCDTGKVVYRGNGTSKTASAEGTAISHSYNVDKNCVVLGYFYCSSTVANAETTFEDLAFTLTEKFNPAVVDEPYNGKRMTGDGTMTSIDGVNNIMSHEATFTVKVNANYADNPIGLLPSGAGVSF